jgi:hypothetical protein
MIIDGIFASETPDSSGEIISIKGCDITDLNNGTGCVNYEHKSGDGPNSTPLDIIGTILDAKKIFKQEDCGNERENMYWNKVKVPFIYGRARLYDGAGHPGAMAAAAIIRDHAANNEKILLRYSIEGSTIERDGQYLNKTVARRVAATIKPCNRSCDSGILADPQAKSAPQNVEVLADRLLGQKKEESAKKFENFHPGYVKLGGSPEFEYTEMAKGDVKDLSAVFAQKQKENEEKRKLDSVKQFDASDLDSHPYTSEIASLPKQYGGTFTTTKRVYDHTHILPPEAQTNHRLFVERYGHGLVMGVLLNVANEPGSVPRVDYISDGSSVASATKQPQVNNYFAFDNHNIKPMLIDLVKRHAMAVAQSKISKFETLDKADAVGNANAAPSTLTGHAALQREELHGRKKRLFKEKLKEYIIKKAKEAADKKPAKETESSWSGDKPLNDGLPDVSDKFLDTFEDVTEGIDKIGPKKVKKSEVYFNQLATINALRKEEKKLDSLIDGVPSGAMGWTQNGEGKPVIVKPADKAGPEAATYELAKMFGVGDYLPHVVVDPKSKKVVIQGVDVHPPEMMSHGKRVQIYKGQKPEDIQKVVILDAVSKNHDRFFGGHGFKDGKMVFLDHGNAFAPENYQNKSLAPSYLAHVHSVTTPEVATWVQGIDSSKVLDMLKKHGVVKDDAHAKDIVEHIEDVKANVKPNYDLKLLFDGRG